jgi:hypothetical protein
MESRVDTSLRQGLAALPLEAPPRDAWASIRARMETPQTPTTARRVPTPWWLALAAGLAVIALLPAMWSRPELVTTVASDAQLSALMQRSRALESEIRGLRAASPTLAQVQYQWESAIESDLAVVDVGLTANSHQQAPLWRERVRLLEELKTAAQMDTGPLLLQARLD